MGCDIHLRLEKRLKKDKPYYNEFLDHDNNRIKKCYYTDKNRKWQNCYIFTNDYTWGERCYGMFAILNDVRNYWEDKVKPLENKGFPVDACQATIKNYSYQEWKGDGEIPDWGHYADKEDLDRWLKNGYSKEINIKDRNGNIIETRITDPDAHSPNWCTTEEMEYCINQIFKDENGNYNGDADEWLALLGAMKGYEASGYYECRAVFWFDN